MKQRFCTGMVLLALLAAAGCTAPPSDGRLSDRETNLFDPDRPPTARTLYILADITAAKGRDRESQLLLERITDEYPGFFPAYNRLAEAHMRNRRIPEAVEVLSAGLAIDPREPVLLNNLGMCRLIRKDYHKALVCFTEASNVVPAHPRYRSNMATALTLLGRHEEALVQWQQVLPLEEAMENVQVLSGPVE